MLIHFTVDLADYDSPQYCPFVMLTIASVYLKKLTDATFALSLITSAKSEYAKRVLWFRTRATQFAVGPDLMESNLLPLFFRLRRLLFEILDAKSKTRIPLARKRSKLLSCLNLKKNIYVNPV